MPRRLHENRTATKMTSFKTHRCALCFYHTLVKVELCDTVFASRSVLDFPHKMVDLNILKFVRSPK